MIRFISTLLASLALTSFLNMASADPGKGKAKGHYKLDKERDKWEEKRWEESRKAWEKEQKQAYKAQEEQRKFAEQYWKQRGEAPPFYAVPSAEPLYLPQPLSPQGYAPMPQFIPEQPIYGHPLPPIPPSDYQYDLHHGADTGARIGDKIGWALGGLEGAAIGADIGRDLGIQLQQR
jgi:hypothetical protein